MQNSTHSAHMTISSGESINFGAPGQLKWRGPFVLAWRPYPNNVQSVYITHEKIVAKRLYSDIRILHTGTWHTEQFCLWEEVVFDHPRSGVVYNFGRVCVSSCLYVCLSDDNFRKPWRRKFIYARAVYLCGLSLQVEFVYEGHWVKLKVTGVWCRKFLFPHCKTSIAITPVLSNTEPWCLCAQWINDVTAIYHVTGSEHK